MSICILLEYHSRQLASLRNTPHGSAVAVSSQGTGPRQTGTLSCHIDSARSAGQFAFLKKQTASPPARLLADPPTS